MIVHRRLSTSGLACTWGPGKTGGSGERNWSSCFARSSAPVPGGCGFLVFPVRLLVLAVDDESTFLFVGFAMGFQTPIEEPTRIVWLVVQEHLTGRVSRPGAIGWAATRLCLLDTPQRLPAKNPRYRAG
jgi:hypothetical protein